ncbi:hypothetical protein C0992_011883 [Termitomyces sp. T32_za158]|nr:hypothetical protein C0992_011883 [Termitomyces sp. T32_za158]
MFESHQEIMNLIRCADHKYDTSQSLLTHVHRTSSSLSVSDGGLSVSTSSSLLPVPSLNKDDFPQVKNWTRQEYTTAKKKKATITSLRSTTENSANSYIETKEGEPVDKVVMHQVRAHARHLWRSLHSRGIAPPTWAAATLEAYNYYEHHMCQKFPELSYGANNWKAHMVATENYPSWYNNHIGHPKVKNEATILKRSPSPAIPQSQISASYDEPEPKRIKSSNPIDIVLEPAVTITSTEKENIAPLPIINPLVPSAATQSETMSLPTSNHNTTKSPRTGNIHPSGTSDGILKLAVPSTIASSMQENHGTGSQTTSLSINPTVVVSIPSSQSISVVNSDLSLSTNEFLASTPHRVLDPPSNICAQPILEPLSVATQNSAIPSGNKLLTRVTTSSGAGEVQLALPRGTTAKKGKRAAAGKGMNGKSLCKREWIIAHPDGLEDEFAVYWSSLVASGESKVYDSRAKVHPAANST